MTANQYAKLCRMGEVERVERLGGPGRCRLLFPPVRVFGGGRNAAGRHAKRIHKVGEAGTPTSWG